DASRRDAGGSARERAAHRLGERAGPEVRNAGVRARV
ncbi:MAG: hypothetical protein AVDCRST_MAG01-01-2816, partial [uncultured Rubrobacteraceae bacterium]